MWEKVEIREYHIQKEVIMEREKQHFRSDKHIIIMGILSLFFALFTAAPSVASLFFISGVPTVCSILFLVKKYPAFGAICTLFFFLNRIATFTKGTLLSTVFILALTGYFAYVTYLSNRDWKLRKANRGKNKEI